MYCPFQMKLASFFSDSVWATKAYKNQALDDMPPWSSNLFLCLRTCPIGQPLRLREMIACFSYFCDLSGRVGVLMIWSMEYRSLHRDTPTSFFSTSSISWTTICLLLCCSYLIHLVRNESENFPSSVISP